MKKPLAAGLAMLGAMAMPGAADAADPDLAARIEASREVVKSFGSTLQSELAAAMEKGGPLEALAVCNMVAPGIAQTLSNEKGWEVGRTSLKVRNSDNAPDRFERAVLGRFKEQKAEGADPASLEHAEVVTKDGDEVFRYMKAIPTAGICVACHGSDLAPEVAAKIDELYPNDEATGFAVGDIRGAFTIEQPM